MELTNAVIAATTGPVGSSERTTSTGRYLVGGSDVGAWRPFATVASKHCHLRVSA